MSQSNPDKLGKNAGASFNFAMHFHAKSETLTEVYADETIDDSSTTRQSDEESNNGQRNQQFYLPTDSELKSEKMPGSSEPLGSHSPSPSEYRKIFKNFNEFTEKITKTVEEKIFEIKSDINSSRSRIVSSKDNSSLSDSEDNSESSRIFDLKSLVEESSRKSAELPQNIFVAGQVDSEIEVFEVGSGLRQRKKAWVPEVFKCYEEIGGHGLIFDDNIEIESAVEAYENIILDESDDEESQYFDAKDYNVTAGNAGGEPPREGELIKFLRFVNNNENKKLEGYAAFLTFCLLVLPMPSFVRGFLTCLLIIVFWCLFNDYIRSVIEPHPSLPTTPFCVPDYSILSPLKVPRILQEEGVWFNEFTQPYDPDWYSVSQTVPVYLEIENCYLKLSRPKGKISKRATCDEKKYKLEFINQRIYDLRYCRISLKPEGIIRRRFFSKKYPIVIELGRGSFVKAIKYKESTGEEDAEIDVESTYKVTDSGGGKSLYGRKYLNLFARCNRQKEEWFRRLKSASRNHTTRTIEDDNEVSASFENLKFDPEIADYEEYWQYMIKFVGDVRYDTPILKTYFLRKMKSGRYKVGRKKKDIPAYENIPPGMRKKTLHMQHSTKDNGPVIEKENGPVVKSALEVQWLNALINRFLYDIFRTPYWLNKIQAKIQRKLASIRLPYYVEALEVIELNLGKVGPRFHRISAPVLDERGLWVDMDLTFDGSFKMILQTQLNLIKLQKGLEEEVAKLPDEKQETRSVGGKNVDVTSSSLKKVNHKSSAKELLMEFAEIIVSDSTIVEKDQASVNAADMDNSDSTESDEDDEDEDYRTETASNNLTIGQNETSNEPRKLPARRSSKRIFRVMESVAQSKYFKSIAETKYVQKAIAGVSATKLRLILEVKSCVGTLSVNVPPPPNDRIWYGFRDVPKLWMSAQPKVGQRNIRFSHIKHFVERKILEEIKKLIVMPNMDDLLLPIPPDDLISRIVSMTGAEMKLS